MDVHFFQPALPRKARPSVQLDTPTGCKRQTAFDIESPQWVWKSCFSKSVEAKLR